MPGTNSGKSDKNLSSSVWSCLELWFHVAITVSCIGLCNVFYFSVVFLGGGERRIHWLLPVTCPLTVDEVAYIWHRTFSAVNVICKN